MNPNHLSSSGTAVKTNGETKIIDAPTRREGQLQSYRHVPYPYAAMSEPHIHNDIELNFIISGSALYLFGDQQWTFQAGYVYLFWAAIPHQLINVERDTQYFAVHLPLAHFLRWQLPAPFVQRVLIGQPIATPDQRHAEWNRTLFERWHQHIEANTSEHDRITLLEIEASLRHLALTANASTARPRSDERSVNIDLVEQMITFIKGHFRDSLTVAQVAESVNLHPNYAMGLFRQHTGRTIVTYLNQYRIVYAQQALLTTEKSVLEIALEAGFGSVSRFYQVFKESCGLSPKRYRQTLRPSGRLTSWADLHSE